MKILAKSIGGVIPEGGKLEIFPLKPQSRQRCVILDV